MEKIIVQDLLCNAFEGGSNYWYQILDHNKTAVKAEFVSMLLAEEGGWIKIKDTIANKEYDLFNWQIERAINLMKTKHFVYYKEALEECSDATTGDIFLQLIVFNEVIYG